MPACRSVSVSTVLNNTAPVSPSLKAKVLKAVEELGYVPDAVARSLKTGRSRTIGLIVPDITNPHFSAVASAIEIACDASGYALLLCNTTTDSPAKELRDLHLMRRQRVDGVILVPSGSGEAYVAELTRAATMPVVLIDRTLEGFDADAVVLDNRAASFGIVDYLVAGGAPADRHRRRPERDVDRRGAPCRISPGARRARDRLSRGSGWRAAPISRSPTIGPRRASWRGDRGRPRSSRPATTR